MTNMPELLTTGAYDYLRRNSEWSAYCKNTLAQSGFKPGPSDLWSEVQPTNLKTTAFHCSCILQEGN